MTVARPQPRHARRAPGHRDRGASSVELVMYTPVLMLVTFLIVQFALSWYGNDVAGATAREAARVARTGGGTPEALAAAEARGVQYATAVGGEGLTDVTVDLVLVDAQTVRATVRGRAVELVPGFVPHVEAHVEGQVESFRADL